MKIPPSRRGRGFTLVELLVVIAIIAVLAAAGFAAGNAAIQKAKKTTALSSAVAIESAVNNFFTEYGSMPKEVSGSTETETTDTVSDKVFLQELLGLNTSANALNTRSVKFLSAKSSKNKPSDKNPKDGIVYEDSGAPKGLYDPWGGPFFVALDGDFNDRVVVDPKAGGSKTLNGRKVAVWSNGADCTGLPGSSGKGKSGDDVITW